MMAQVHSVDYKGSNEKDNQLKLCKLVKFYSRSSKYKNL